MCDCKFLLIVCAFESCEIYTELIAKKSMTDKVQTNYICMEVMRGLFLRYFCSVFMGKLILDWEFCNLGNKTY